jgi:hypothetical protein
MIFETLICYIYNSLFAGNDKPGRMLEGQTFTIGIPLVQFLA